jgi:hypothetical protein
VTRPRTTLRGDEPWETNAEMLARVAWNALDAELEDTLEAAQQKYAKAKAFRCNVDESCGAADDDAYPADDPKHPNWHSNQADLWDGRERG